MTKYLFTEDPGHGWLHVKREELGRLGIANKITPYSYQCGDTVYLEEDYDLRTFMLAKEQQGEIVDLDRQYVAHTPIRGYECYRCEGTAGPKEAI